jgi:hypothetical protein
VLIRITKLVLLITKLHFKDLERNVGEVGEKNRTIFYVFNKVLAFQMRGNVM